MAGLRPWGVALLLALLGPLAQALEGAREAPEAETPAASRAPSLPLMQILLSQAPPRSWLPGGSRRRASGQPLRYMRNLYRSVADRHGRPRRDERLSSNTIRLVRPSAKARQAGAGELGPGLSPGPPATGARARRLLNVPDRSKGVAVVLVEAEGRVLGFSSLSSRQLARGAPACSTAGPGRGGTAARATGNLPACSSDCQPWPGLPCSGALPLSGKGLSLAMHVWHELHICLAHYSDSIF